MKIHQAIQKIKRIQFPAGSPPVVKTVIEEFCRVNPIIQFKEIPSPLKDESGVFNIAVFEQDSPQMLRIANRKKLPDRYLYFRINEDGSGWLAASPAYYLFSFAHGIFDTFADDEIGGFKRGKLIVPSFRWQRISYDYFLTQEGRLQRHLNRASYVRELARLGFTHIEVNGLAYPMSLETGPKGEIYPMFYTYCPALDQFVHSDLNKGLYPEYFLSANLKFLKQNAELARKYGLIPGLLCFEPRSVPERFFKKYPMLRGARVDHPFRSFQPRYNMTIVHPMVQEHYTSMMRNLLREVPELGFISIWTNDSGAGFEHTKSLYVGRNGGAYLIREWKDDEEIARIAGENALNFFRLLRDAAREINPDFRVITRLESFYGEHETIWNGLEEGIEVETASLIARGWDSPYSHPRYSDVKEINAGTVYQSGFDRREKSFLANLKRRRSDSHFYAAFGPHSMFEPLLGVPYPRLTYEKLKVLHEAGVKNVAHCGGTYPQELVPYNVNHEIVRRFQLDPAMDADRVISDFAEKWAGKRLSKTLIRSWKMVEKAILAFPNVTPLYSTHGFTWYRLWARPLVPNIEAIPQEKRNYYQDFMCTTPHNPNNVDLSRDVLFQLTTPERANQVVARIDRNVFQPLNNAIKILGEIIQNAPDHLRQNNVIYDQLIRLRALHCWLMTQRNVAAWIAGVHGYINATEDSERKRWRKTIKDMMIKEIQNTENLIALFDSGIEFMALTEQGETPLIYGSNLPEHLARRLELMRAHINNEPYFDPQYMLRKSGEIL